MQQALEHSFLREDEARTERWAHLTEGIDDDYQRAVVETLMDNTKRLVSGNLPQAKLEDTTTQSIATFNRVAYPMIRRIYPGLVANDLVSIQPMTLPVTLVFFIDFVYGTGISPTNPGDRTDYEAGLFNPFYSAGVVRDEGLGTATADQTTFSTEWHPIRQGSETVYVDSVPVTNYQIDYRTGQIVFDEGLSGGQVVTADYALVQEGLGDAGNSGIPELELDMSSAQVGSESRKIKAKWTIEAKQDMQAYHGRSVERELVRHMADQVRQEIDRNIITDLIRHATAGNVNWSKSVPAGEKKQDHYETLMHAITDVSNEIYKKRFRHGSWVIMHPDTLTMLNKINSFRALGWGQDGKVPGARLTQGPNVVGTLSETFRVVVDPLFDQDKVLVGYKGNNFDETAYIFSPYVAFQTETFTDPNTMKQVKGMMRRDGRHVVSGDYLGTVTLTA